MEIQFCFCYRQNSIAIVYKFEAKGPHSSSHNIYMKFDAHMYTHTHIHTHTHTHTQSHATTPSVYMVDCGAPQSSNINSVVLKDFFQVMHTQPFVIPMDHGFQILSATCVPLLPQVKCTIHNDMIYSLSHVFP